MSLTEEFLKDVLIAPEVIISPWDNQRFRVRFPTSLEAEETPTEYTSLGDFLEKEYDQGRIGSCVGHSNDIVRSVMYYLSTSTYTRPEDFSAWSIYQWSREMANIPPHVEGSTNLGAMKALHKIGACLESTWPTPMRLPGLPEPANARIEAAAYKISSYWQVGHTEAEIKAAIYGITSPFSYEMPDGSPGKAPVVTALPIFNTIVEADGDGIVPMPKFGDTLLGGHSTPYMGWEIIDDDFYWTNRGTWGNDVGKDGWFFFPKNYPLYDVWVMHVGGEPQPPAPSPCPYGNAAAHLINAALIHYGRNGRVYYMNPLRRRGGGE